MGGLGANGTYFNDVWYSTDGVNWTEATASAPWSGRLFHTSVVIDGKMWVIGGRHTNSYLNDVWYSTDGVNWIEATASAPWSGRDNHKSIAFDGKMWVIGGRDTNSYLNDVWYSTDGVNWTEAPPAFASWVDRGSHTLVELDGKMWVIGGIGTNSYLNDVWCSDGFTSIEDSGTEVPAVVSVSAKPNPFSNSSVVITIEGFSGSCDFTIYDIQGHVVEHDSAENSYLWNDDSAPNGTYFAVVSDGHGNRASVRMVRLQ